MKSLEKFSVYINKNLSRSKIAPKFFLLVNLHLASKQTKMAPVEEYTEGEKILCYHGPLLYEAKCLKIRKNEEENLEYLVHYQGWNKNWDEWVPISRILKYNDTNLNLQKELAESQKEARSKRSKSSKAQKTSKEPKAVDVKSEGSVHDPDSRSSTPSLDQKNRKEAKKLKNGKEECLPPSGEVQEAKSTESEQPASSEADVAISEPSQTLETNNVLGKHAPPEQDVPPPVPEKRKATININDIKFTKEEILSNPSNALLKIPQSLERWIIDDWDQITRLTRLVNLPAEFTVVDILEKYKCFKFEKTSPEKHEEIKNMVTVVNELFCRCLGSFLLHKWERPQYSDMLETYPGVQVSRIYGAHHFLRMFVKLSQVLEGLPAEVVEPVSSSLEDLLEFLREQEKSLFRIDNFGIATPEYHRRAL